MPNPYTTTDSTEVVANYLYTQLGVPANMATFVDAGGTAVQGVWYGDDSELLPTTPCLCVVPGAERSVYQGSGGRPVMMTFTTFVMVYYGKVIDQQLNVHGSQQIANVVKRFVSADISLGGNVIDCYCTSLEPGVARRNGAQIDATRLTFTSRSKVLLNP